ncbi:hypothetical protein VZT92_022846 [Zoarces viviparus]|uniref:Uncharacterized protein n=1 Tax=Zoarces viviparus TaxID=48416 RepID=A0AAW1E8H2_ZOAVI
MTPFYDTTLDSGRTVGALAAAAFVKAGRHLHRFLTERLLASWPPAPFLLWLLSLSQLILTAHNPADPPYLSPVKWEEDGGMRMEG